MAIHRSRRTVLRALAGAGLVGVLPEGFRLSRAEAQVTPDLVGLRPEIEPLVELLERTPREKCVELLADQLRDGVSYRRLLAALFLAGVRNVNPCPPGFAMHCVFVIHSAHLMSMEAPPDGRMLPLFYAADQFKASQERDARSEGGGYTMRPLSGKLPSAEQARAEFLAAMEAWDMDRAERAVVSMARYRGSGEVFELLVRYGARDYRNIGHKAIYVANAQRTLQAIGWEHAEPVLRSLVRGLLDFGRDRSVNGYAYDDQVYHGNLKRTREIHSRLPAGWAGAASDQAAVRSLVEAVRQATPEEACAEAAKRLQAGRLEAGSVWDAVHLAAAELRMRARQTGLVALHAVTSANALHHAWLASADPETRLLMLLQGIGWMAQFRTFAASREPEMPALSIGSLEPGEAIAKPAEAIAEALNDIPAQPERAAARVFTLARDREARLAFLTAANSHVVRKSNDAHYYKYAAALLEDAALVSPMWQPHLVATMVYYLKGSGDPETPVVSRARELLRPAKA